MKKQQIQISENKRKKAFTLVELIIVITILAILATIAFVSFGGYTKNSRDANRMSILGNIQKAMSIHFTQTSQYPVPESVYLTGFLNNITLTEVGVIGENITQLLRLSKLPLDPQSNSNYVYATSPNYKQFQITATLEGNTLISQLTRQLYAENQYAYVVGDYKGLLNYNGSIYNLPSLIISGTGDLLQTSYVVNNGNNIAYSTNGDYLNNTQSVEEVLMKVGSTSTSITGIILPTTKEEFLNNSGTYLKLGYEIDVIGENVFGTQYYAGGNIQALSSGVSNPTTPTCTEFTYSTWGACQSDNTQIRNILSSAPEGCEGGSPILSQSCTYFSSVSNLLLTHSPNNKNFTFSWTGGIGNGSCKLQYLNSVSAWVDINGLSYNCDANITNQSVILPNDGWYNGWSNVPVRVVKILDNSLLGQFSQNLTCNIISSSSISTPTIDEDCDGNWNENAYYWKITGSTERQKNCYTNRQDVICGATNFGTNLGPLYGNGSDRFGIDGANLFYMQTCLDSSGPYIHYYVTCANDKYN